MEYTKKIYLTRLDKSYNCDKFFPMEILIKDYEYNQSDNTPTVDQKTGEPYKYVPYETPKTNNDFPKDNPNPNDEDIPMDDNLNDENI